MILQDQTILISGAGGSVGAFLAKELSKSVKKVIGIDLNEGSLNHDDNIEYHGCDLTNSEEVTNVLSPILENHRVTVLINLAGQIHSEPLINLLNRTDACHSFSNWDKVVKANMYSVFNLSAIVAEQMVKKRTKGLIINTSSVAAQGNLGQTAYAAAKAGIEAMTKVWSKELGMFRIRCACISPGFFDTPSTHNNLNESNIDKWKKMTPVGKLGSLDEFLSGIKFIVENDYFNGKILQLDGGLNV
ncbi:MAG: SDR family NAD(P)-dependent oxidoreductase [Cyclobacteriaceae bacterium]